MSTSPQPVNFALICTICGNNKTFSDLSHTLTHLNSRGHLQQKHRLELQAPTDPGVQTTLNNYNVWYTSNNIASLLSERMNIPKGGAKKAAYKPKPKKPIKAEDLEDGETPASELAVTRTQPQRFSHQPNYGDVSDPLDSPWAQDTYDGSGPSHISGYVPVLIPIDPMLSSMMNSNGKPKGGGPLELKGEIHEGMDVFDAATPRTKRLRNQRKDPEVLKRMERNSAEVVSEELSFHPNGDFRAVRDIFGPPSSSEPSSPAHLPSPKKRKATRLPPPKPAPVMQHSTAKLPVRVTKPVKFTFAPGTGRRSPARRSTPTQGYAQGPNYLNPSMANMHRSGPTPNPFMQGGNEYSGNGYSGNGYSGHGYYAPPPRGSYPDEHNDYKPAPVQFAVPKLASAYTERGMSYGNHDAYSGNGFGYQRQEDVRGGNMQGGFANPLSSAFPRYQRQSESPRQEESRFDYQNHGLPSSHPHSNEPNALRASQTPVPQVRRLEDTHKPEPSMSQQSRPGPGSSASQWPKLGQFQTSNNRSEQFPYRAHEGFRPVAVMNGDSYGRKDQGRQDASSRQFASTRNPNNDITLARRQTTPVNKPYPANNGRVRDEAFPGRDRDGQVKPTPRTSFNSANTGPRSRSPDRSSSRPSVQSTPHSHYGPEIESDYYDDQYRGYDGERQ